MRIRQTCRLSQKEVAERLDVAQSTYHSWENDTTYPKARHFARLVEVFGVGMPELLDPDWIITLSQPLDDEQERGKTLMQGNALRLFELLSETQRRNYNVLEEKIRELEEKIIRLENQL